MEVAPLALAHTHARNAVLETRKANPVAASEEHDLAAGEFATAAQSSSDHEALRTLRLLETHHKKLAEILRFQHEHPSNTPAEPASATATSTLATQQTTAETGGTKSAVSQDAHLPPRLVGNARLPSRDKSSIASNLASARGIPSHPRRGSPVSPTLTSQHVAAKMTEAPQRAKVGEARLRDGAAKSRQSRISTPRQPWSPPTPSTEVVSQQSVPPSAAEPGGSKDKPAITDEAFNRFYSAFGGLVSKVSGPLAFAGIQMGPTDPVRAEQSRKSSAEVKVDRDHAVLDRSMTAGEPDVNKLFSRAALRSIRDGSGAGPGNPAESFYVVPTTGGTMSYAGILTRADKQARRNSIEDGDDDFVDARETPSSPEMRHSASGSRVWAGRRGASDKLTAPQTHKTMEEMQMENETLRNLTDSLATRLHMWEVSAQSSSMALQQSIRMMHRQSGGTPDYAQPSTATTSPVATLTAPPAAADTDARIKELEEQIQRSEKKLETATHENDKLKNVLGRYRDRWEKLKEGAKTRRAEGRSGDSQSNPPASGASKPSAPSVSPDPGRGPSTGQADSRAAGDNPA
ncbi:hypothetical protein E8E15_009327 [Penicillium rubens]|uniref:Pc22g14700 protein n=2 Tax=Penicillium chrysogenum species complex TaxID=254878 RepID=B6HVA7_PENRW|nr:uncharacterized protein N7525_004903 [Penicillium rubens]KZN91106.1 hypothetical protein EN45_012340 [Penicillium chrysogenum]CAP98758.1 Pc22g14700 [Penicillium rubens Wisconsin 54-1255]KAF3027445.1 hypothetical protein E8E15_009327 [Penicillium rubens]KAJ5044367.1 hypothetical protein NUH16_001169 [Penicillium rubens]KAJ5839715.1 hypothetical protein N7525_004903 [Penicillium rubens]